MLGTCVRFLGVVGLGRDTAVFSYQSDCWDEERAWLRGCRDSAMEKIVFAFFLLVVTRTEVTIIQVIC